MSESCVWTETDEYWAANCGAAHVFIDGNPEQNDHKYCPYCGKPLMVKDENAE